MTQVTGTQSDLCVLAGVPWPVGARPVCWNGDEGVNFAVFSLNAKRVEVCLFDAEGVVETGRFVLPSFTDGVWHGFVPGLVAGQNYGLRAYGEYAPARGSRFNPSRLLIDPYARDIVGDVRNIILEHDYVQQPGLSQGILGATADERDNASRMPKSRVLDWEAELRAGAALCAGPSVHMDRTVLYEAHVKGLTRCHPEIPESQRGSYAALASVPMLEHYRRLGITTLCLLPVQMSISEAHLLRQSMTNYWGYNTLCYFVPEPRYASQGCSDVRAEFRQMVDTLHRNGFEVVLDVVYNHSAEGGAAGPTLSWRGLDNASWYVLDRQGHHLNHSGCGNSLSLDQPPVIQMVMDSLRWWVQAFGVDGFRFDLATALGRERRLDHHFNPVAALLTAIGQDPVLGKVKRIAEPWDIGPEGYQLGNFPAGWSEWNDRFRDTIRAYWLGHPCSRGEFARRLCGSSDRFQHDGRSPLAGINMVTAHDGFSLADLVAYRDKHNFANGEENRDGHNHNLSANAGVEGPSDDPIVVNRRKIWQRALLATLCCAQGVVQLLAGDELGHSQGGNNNAYCQDNPVTWLDWDSADFSLVDYVGALIRVRRLHPALGYHQWFTGYSKANAPEGAELDISWFQPDGRTLGADDWEQGSIRSFACKIVVSADEQEPRERILLLIHAGEQPFAFVLPSGLWRVVVDSASGRVCQDVSTNAEPALSGSVTLGYPTLMVLWQARSPFDTRTVSA